MKEDKGVGMRQFILVAAAFWAQLFLVTGATAQSEDVFVVPRVPVSAQAGSAREAKAIAQDMGRRSAMDILLRRLTVEKDWIYLPRLADGQAANAAASSAVGKNPVVIDQQILESLESGFVVYGEKSSANTYRAYITYRFKPDAVRRILRQSRVPYSESQTRAALVLPVLQTNSNVYLWQKNNPWLAAWKRRPFTHELTPMTAPLGDLEDQSLISANQALNLNQQRLRAIAEHYNVSQVVIAHARVTQDGGRDTLAVRLINGYQTSITGRTGGEVDPLVVDELKGSDAVAETAGRHFQSSAGTALGQVHLSEESGNFPSLAARAIELALADYGKEWKASTLIDYGSELLMEATALFRSVGEWANIRAALIETPLVGGVQVSALSRRGAEMRMRIYGDPDRLATSLSSKGLVLWTYDGERWFIAGPDTANYYQSRRPLKFRGRGLFSEGQTDPRDAYLPASEQQSAEKGTKVEQ